jgi:hypothetical protein
MFTYILLLQNRLRFLLTLRYLFNLILAIFFITPFLLFLIRLTQSLYLCCFGIYLKIFELPRDNSTNILQHPIHLTPSILRKPLILKNSLINVSILLLKFLQTPIQQIRHLFHTHLYCCSLLILFLLLRKKYLLFPRFFSKPAIKSFL